MHTQHLAAELPKNLTIAKATQEDLSDIVDIYNQAITSKLSTAELTMVSSSDKQAWFNAHMQNPKRPIYVLKNADNLLVAWGSFSDLYSRQAYHITAEISIYIHQTQQGQGLGKCFTSWMLQQTDALGIQQVVAKIFAHNTASLAMFKKLGFKQWGYLPQVCDMEGFLADVVILGMPSCSVSSNL